MYKLNNKPYNCLFCGEKIFTGVDPTTLECFIECQNPNCIGKPSFRGIQYGNIEEILNELIIVWNRSIDDNQINRT